METHARAHTRTPVSKPQRHGGGGGAPNFTVPLSSGYKPTLLVHYFGPEIGWGAFAPNFPNFVVVYASGLFSAPFAHNLDTKTVELSAKKIVQGRLGLAK